jgi:hypothetical protein
MNNVVIQLKKKYDQVDLRNYCKECKKIPFLLRNNGILYGLNESLIDYENKEVMIINNKKHVVINADNNFNYDDLLKRLVITTSKVQNKTKQYDFNNILLYLQMEKESNYYKNKYYQNITISSLLRNELGFAEKYLSIKNTRNNSNLYNIEVQIEKTYSKEYLTEILYLKKNNPMEYHFKIQTIINVLEDPCSIFNYLKNIKVFSLAYLLAEHICDKYRLDDKLLTYEDTLFNFDNLIYEFTQKHKNIIKYKMIHAKLHNITGKLINTDIEKIIYSDNLFYFPEFIIFEYDNKIYKKYGEFILRLEGNNIIECYECFNYDSLLK